MEISASKRLCFRVFLLFLLRPIFSSPFSNAFMHFHFSVSWPICLCTSAHIASLFLPYFVDSFHHAFKSLWFCTPCFRVLLASYHSWLTLHCSIFELLSRGQSSNLFLHWFLAFNFITIFIRLFFFCHRGNISTVFLCYKHSCHHLVKPTNIRTVTRYMPIPCVQVLDFLCIGGQKFVKFVQESLHIRVSLYFLSSCLRHWNKLDMCSSTLLHLDTFTVLWLYTFPFWVHYASILQLHQASGFWDSQFCFPRCYVFVAATNANASIFLTAIEIS